MRSYSRLGPLGVLSASRSPGLVRFFGHAWVVLPSDGVPLLDHNKLRV